MWRWLDFLREEWLGLVVVLLVWAVPILLVPPIGEYPVGDDWDYAATARDLVRHREIRLSDWPAMPLIVHAVWGAVCIAMFGDSYATLRSSNLVMLLIGACGVYAFARHFARRRDEFVFLAAAFLFNPLALSMSYSFHTNVTGAAFVAWSLVAIAYCVRSNASLVQAILVGVVGSAGFLVRQTAAAPAIATAAVLLVTRQTNRVTRTAGIVLPLLVTWGAHSVWLDYFHGRPFNSNVAVFDTTAFHLGAILNRTVRLLLGTALFVAPVSLQMLTPSRRRKLFSSTAFVRAGAFGVLILIAAALLSENQLRVCSDLHVYDFGIGNDSPLTPGRSALRGPAITIGQSSVSIFHIATTALALMSAYLLFGLTGWHMSAVQKADFDCGRHVDRTLKAVLATSCTLLVVLFLLIRVFFEWYLIPLILLLGILITRLLPSDNRGPGLCAWATLSLFGVFAVVGVQDCMVRNSARWAAIAQLHDAGIGPDSINAGLEYTGVYRFSPQYRGGETRRRPYLSTLDPWLREIHLAAMTTEFDSTREFTLAYDTASGFDVVLSVPFHSWFRTGHVFALRKGRDPKSINQ